MTADAAPAAVTTTLADLVHISIHPPTGPIGSHAPEFVLDAQTPIDEAARLLADRAPAQQGTPLTVTFPGGRSASVTPEELLSAVLAHRPAAPQNDTLTDLYSRPGFLAEAGRLLGDDSSGALMVIVNVDRFKDINEAYGHDAGDLLLRQIADALRRFVAGQAAGRGIAGRFGRDEYAVLVIDPTRAPDETAPNPAAQNLAEQIQQAVRGPFGESGVPIEVEVSIGVAGPAGPMDTAVTLLRRADTAMHQAKLDRIGIEVWTPRHETIRQDDLTLLAELRHAIPDGQLLLHYQPLIDASTGRLHGVEALVRWRHPTRGMIPPMAFLPQAERSDVIFPLTDWVMEEALHQVAVWMRADARIPVSVNVSAVCLAREALAGTVFRLLDAYQVPPDLLTIEVTESAVMTDPDRAAARLTVLRERGVRVSIDDFGTGHTSLLLLTQLPIDELKLDRAFVSRVNDSASHQAIVRAVAGIAHGLGVTAVGEGIEDEATAESLRSHGFTLLQGFHLGRPVPPEDIRTADRPRPIPVEIARVLAAASSPTAPERPARTAAGSRSAAPITLVAPTPSARRRLDALTAAAAQLCDASTGLLILCEPDKYDVRATATFRHLPPLGDGDNPLLNKACEDGWLEVADTSRAPMFAGNPLTRDAGYRYFAAAPVNDPAGTALGVLCVLDEAPQNPKPRHRPALQSIADSCGAVLTGTPIAPDLKYLLAGLHHSVPA